MRLVVLMTAEPDAFPKLWQTVAELWMGVTLGEIPGDEGLRDLLDASERHLGVPCAIVDRAGAVLVMSGRADPHAHGSRTSHELRDALGQPCGMLVFYGEPPLLAGDRLARIMGAVLDGGSQVSFTRRFFHDMRNKLTALLVNIELVESMVEDADPSRPLLDDVDRGERVMAIEAISLSARATRALIQAIKRPSGS